MSTAAARPPQGASLLPDPSQQFPAFDRFGVVYAQLLSESVKGTLDQPAGNRQIAQLRAEGEFQKADDLLEISQTYLLKLLELEQWAAEYQLDTQKFQASVAQWQQEFALQMAKLLI